MTNVLYHALSVPRRSKSRTKLALPLQVFTFACSTSKTACPQRCFRLKLQGTTTGFDF